MNKVVIILVAAGLSVMVSVAGPPAASPAVRVQDGLVSISAAGAPLSEVLPPVCRAAGCEWVPDPALTNRVSLSVSGLTPRAALFRVLAPFDYVILWRPDRPSRVRIIGPASGGEPEPAQPVPTGPAALFAGGPVLEMAAAYAAEANPGRREELETRLREITDPEAEPELRRLASREPGAPLQAEALAALANMGSATAADFLLARVEAAGPDAEDAAALVANIALSPRTSAALRVAALGNKRVASVPARLAALRGLARVADSGARAVLETLSRDPDATIRSAARACLNEETGGL